MEILILIFAISLILNFIVRIIESSKKRDSNKSDVDNIPINRKLYPIDKEEKEPIKPVSNNTDPIEITSAEKTTTSIKQSIGNEETRIVNFREEIVSQDTKYFTPVTTGESEFYKEKLQDPRWIEKRNKIRQRDKYVCQHCFNIKSLSSLDELDKYMDDYSEKDGSKIAQAVKQEFKYYIKKSINKNGPCTVIFEKRWIQKFQLYQYLLYDQIYHTLKNGKSCVGYLYSNKEITPELINIQHITLDEKIPFKKKEGFGETQSLLLTYSPKATTCGQLLLRALFPLEVYGLEYNGVGQLSLDEYSIFFPLYNLNKFKEVLEVHHITYPISGVPWDIKDEYLETLCHACHIAKHKELKKLYIASIKIRNGLCLPPPHH